MTKFAHHWHSLTCCEFSVDQAASPNLFRRLGRASEVIRQRKLADGAASSFATIAAYWDEPPVDRSIAAASIAEVLGESLSTPVADLSAAITTHQVPVDYSGADLPSLAAGLGLDSDEVVRRHSRVDYVVAAIGFLPNFAYLWGLDPSIAAPRLESPRPRVPAGAVGIAGNQTGIYPQSSPGGWNLIGQVEESVCRDVCPQLSVGDVVQFRATGL